MKRFTNYLSLCATIVATLLATTSCDTISDLIGDSDGDEVDGASTLGIDIKNHECSYDSSTLSITLSTILPYWTSIEEGGEWISESSSYEQNNINYHSYKISTNYGSEERVGVISFYADGGVQGDVTITQSGRGSVELTLSSIDVDNLPEESIWIFTDSKPSSGVREATFSENGSLESTGGEGEFYSLYKALIAATMSEREIILEFPNLEAFPAGALFDLGAYNANYGDIGGDSMLSENEDIIAPPYGEEELYVLRISAPNATSIGNYAFANCMLYYIDFPKVESLGVLSFCNVPFESYMSSNEYLEETITFPSVKTIGQQAFWSCFGGTPLLFPEATDIGKFAFYGSHIDLRAEVITDDWMEHNPEGALTDYSSFPKVERVDDFGFYGMMHGLAGISMPELKSIGKYGFAGASLYSNSTVSLPNLESIGDFGLAYSEVTYFNAPNLTSIGERGFYYCDKLEDVNAESLHTIGAEAFRQCYELDYLDICSGDGVKVQSIAADIFNSLMISENDIFIYTSGDNNTSTEDYDTSSYSQYVYWIVPDGEGGTNKIGPVRMQIAL